MNDRRVGVMIDEHQIDAVLSERRARHDAEERRDIARELETNAERDAEARAAAERRERSCAEARKIAARILDRRARWQALVWDLRRETEALLADYLALGGFVHRISGGPVPVILHMPEVATELGTQLSCVMATLPNNRQQLGPTRWGSVSRYPAGRDLRADAEAQFRRHLYEVIGEGKKHNGDASGKEG